MMNESEGKSEKQYTIPGWLIYSVPLVVAALVKLVVYPENITPFNADEAIVALMARHINQGELPIFFYGQSYMGSFDAILISLGFRLFGEEVWVIRLVQSLLYLGTVLVVMVFAKRVLKSDKAAFYSGMIMAVPPVNVILYSTVSLGGYGEMLLIGNLLILSGLSLIDQIKDIQDRVPANHLIGLFVWSLGAGFGFWIFGLTLVYILPVIIVLIWKYRTKQSRLVIIPMILFLVGSLIGAMPWWLSALNSGDAGVLMELAGGAIREAGQGPVLMRPLQRLVNFFVFGGTVILGLRPPWGIRWLMLPLLPLVLIFWLTVFIYSLRKFKEFESNSGFALLSLIGFVLGIGFILTPYGDDPSGRYFLPLITPMAVFAADFIVNQFNYRRIAEVLLLIFLVIFNLGGLLQSMTVNPPGITTQFDKVAQVDQQYIDELIDFLVSKDIRTGYTNYWVAYPLSFLSGEEIIFLPRLPYHEDFRYTERDDRYRPYTDIVRNADQTAYITTKHPALDQYLQDEFKGLGIDYQTIQIGDFHIFYNLSRPVHPPEIRLGETTTP
jgi:4-amino-4-deoxy-L-arabinose transferase-like glycosyltransferase